MLTTDLEDIRVLRLSRHSGGWGLLGWGIGLVVGLVWHIFPGTLLLLLVPE